ncbi:MAG: SDR family oxidoreductase [Lachnospiraceae bacterium]|nr:SDR family oxidoreductase [Lachnospiraceae bacterium]
MNIVITGTHKGIGYNIAQYYLEKGHTVIGCSRHESQIVHDQYRHFVVDVCDEKQVNDFAKQVRRDYKFVDVLINNAGIAAMNHFMMTPIETAKHLMEVNYLGGLICIRAFASLLKKSEHPRVVNFSTVAVPFNLEGEMAYSSSKAAVESMTKILAKELAMFRITVNAVGPTPIKTDLIAKVPEEKLNKLLDNQAIHRFGEFKDIINVIDFYLNPSSDFITGQIIYLGGVNR